MRILKAVLCTLSVIVFFVSCTKEYSLEGGNNTLPGGTWKFENETVPYNGNIDSSFIRGSGATKVLTIVGKSLNGQQNFLIILNATNSFTTGSYKASLSQSQFKYSTPVKTIFDGDFLTGEFTVEITSLANNSIVGTFSGEVNDSTGSPTDITLGSFVSSINLSNNGTGQVSEIAAGTLAGAGTTCSPATLTGVFTQGVALAASNTVQIKVDITKPGTYTIATNSVNGINFFKTGTFTATGVQDVTLNGAGVPENAGIQNFTVTFGTSNCTFSVTCLPGTTMADYFPLTLNSSWVYGLQGGNATDSFMHRVITYSPVFGGQIYSTIANEEYPLSGTANDSLYFRKSGGDYYEYADVSFAFNFDDPVFAEYIFLKDNVINGTSWQSPDFSGSIGGIPLTGYIKFTIIDKAVPETINLLNFPDVIKVKAEGFLSAVPGAPIFSGESWFARGVGLIYNSGGAGGISNSNEIGQYHVL